MEDATTVAIAKAIKAATLKAARNNLRPGEYPIDETFSLQGYIRVAKDTERTPTANIPVLEALALLLHDAGITGKNALNALKTAMIRALEQDEEVETIISSMRENMDKAEKAVRETLESLPKVPVKGKVTTNLQLHAMELVC